jgi:hypothetical protein
MDQQTSPTTPSRDHRLTLGLLADVIKLLEEHGFELPTEESARNRAHADRLLGVYRLARAFEGQDA